MKVKCLKVFNDLKENIQRQEGDEFEVSQERFEEISKALPDYIEQVKPASKKQGK